MLSKRLLAIANYITPGNRLVDVGTDHAYLPIYAVKQGICPSALAADVRPGPLEAAKRHIREQGLECRPGISAEGPETKPGDVTQNTAGGYVATRLSDGLHAIAPREGETLTISGMGGILIKSILSECPSVRDSFAEIILGPQSDVPLLREWMSARFTIAEDTMIEEDGKYYPVIRYVPGGETLTRTQLRYGKSRCETAGEYVKKEAAVKRQILERLPEGHERRREILADLEVIEEALAEWRIL